MGKSAPWVRFSREDAEFQTFHGILERLKQRGHLNLRTFAYSRFLRQQPHCKEFFHHADLQPTVKLKRIFEWFPKRWLKNIDALLVIQDPLRDSKNPRRCRYITENNFTTIHLGHSVIPDYHIQRRILNESELLEFHSSLIFEYEKLPEDRLIYSAETLVKMQRSGIIKRFHVTPEASKYADMLAAFQKTILFTHEFRTSGRFLSTQMPEYFQMVKTFASENPNIALIMRPHRGRAKKVAQKIRYRNAAKVFKRVLFKSQKWIVQRSIGKRSSESFTCLGFDTINSNSRCMLYGCTCSCNAKR